MNEKNCVEPLKNMLAQAIMVGAKLSQHDYSHDLQDPNGLFLKKEIDGLYKSTQDFLQSSGLDELSGQQVFPVYEEIQKLLDN